VASVENDDPAYRYAKTLAADSGSGVCANRWFKSSKASRVFQAGGILARQVGVKRAYKTIGGCKEGIFLKAVIAAGALMCIESKIVLRVLPEGRKKR
jgi:hypothetical protein